MRLTLPAHIRDVRFLWITAPATVKKSARLPPFPQIPSNSSPPAIQLVEKRSARYNVMHSSHIHQEESVSQDVVIIEAVRTAMGRRNGMLSGTHPVTLGARVLREV